MSEFFNFLCFTTQFFTTDNAVSYFVIEAFCRTGCKKLIFMYRYARGMWKLCNCPDLNVSRIIFTDAPFLSLCSTGSVTGYAPFAPSMAEHRNILCFLFTASLAGKNLFPVFGTGRILLNHTLVPDVFRPDSIQVDACIFEIGIAGLINSFLRIRRNTPAKEIIACPLWNLL